MSLTYPYVKLRERSERNVSDIWLYVRVYMNIF
jgi:hypothetical protein